MTLSPCPSCSTPVSPKAAACPKCGHAFQTPGGINLSDPVHLIGVLLAGLMALGMLAALWGAIR